MAQPFKPVAPPATGRGRIRLSSGLITSLGWTAQQASSFDCYGLFRGREELLCAPIDLQDKAGDHPFGKVFRIVEAVRNPELPISLRDVPSAGDLVASERVIEFKATWTGDTRSQLDLNLGVDVTDRLGWAKNLRDACPIYVGSFGPIFIAMSERRYRTALEEELSL
jgi:hypothetical protein